MFNQQIPFEFALLSCGDTAQVVKTGQIISTINKCAHKVNSLQQLCEKSAPLPRLSVIVTCFQKLSLKLQLEKSQFFTATDKKRDCEKSQRVKRHLLNWTL